MLKLIRHGNVEFQQVTNRLTKDIDNDIVVWYDNEYYGAEEKMKAEGWTFDEEGNAHKGNCHVQNGMFKREQHCYTIARVKFYKCDEFDLETVGIRPFELSDEEFKDLKKVLKDLSEMEQY